MEKVTTGEKFFPLAGQEQLNKERYRSTPDEKWSCGASLAFMVVVSLTGWIGLALLVF